jgi:RNA polymerase sigma-70 factor (ECF subfamily)
MAGRVGDWQRECAEAGSDAGDPDAALVAAAREHPANFAALYRRHIDAVYRYCVRRLGAREAAEDATSQVFMRAIEAFPGYRDGSFRAWLFAIAHNVTANELRAGQARRNVDLDAAGELPDREAGPEVAALATESGRTVRQLLAGLPDRERAMLELRLAGLRSREIAELLGIGHSTVKVAQFRAIRRLRARLGISSQGGDDEGDR